MSEGHMPRVFAKYTLMSVGGMLANSCYILADTFFVAQGLGTQGLAALNLAIPAYNFIYGAGLLLGMGGATRYAVCKSRGDARQACCWGCFVRGTLRRCWAHTARWRPWRTPICG